MFRRGHVHYDNGCDLVVLLVGCSFECYVFSSKRRSRCGLKENEWADARDFSFRPQMPASCRKNEKSQ